MTDRRDQKKVFRFIAVKLVLLLTLVMIFENPALARNERSFIEITKSRHSQTLDDVYTFGLYSSVTGGSNLRTYAGMQFMEFEQNTPGEDSSAIKVLIGQTFGHSFAPFYEIGTDLYGLFSLFDNDRETKTCTDEQHCAIDFYFRLGLRIKLYDNLMLGIFHENIDFGDFHTSLTGEHRYVGGSLGFEF